MGLEWTWKERKNVEKITLFADTYKHKLSSIEDPRTDIYTYAYTYKSNVILYMLLPHVLSHHWTSDFNTYHLIRLYYMDYMRFFVDHTVYRYWAYTMMVRENIIPIPSWPGE